MTATPPLADTRVDPTAAPPMFTPAQIRHLRRAVVVMGLVLLIGFGVVIGRIIYLLNRTTPQAVPVATPPAPADLALMLPAGAAVRSVSLSGDRLAVQYESPGGPGIAVLDLATGLVLHRIPITSEPAKR
jgi:hypothetical protein